MIMMMMMMMIMLVLVPLSSGRLVVTSEADLYLETGQLDTQRQTCQPCLMILLRIQRTQSIIRENCYYSSTAVS